MIPVLYEDNHLLVVVKPANMPVQADRSGDPDILNLLKEYVAEKYHKPGAAYLGLVHRLDRPVGGVMVFARTSKAAARLSSQFAEHTAKKKYAALVRGTPGSLRLLDWLLKDEKTGNTRVVSEGVEGAKRAELFSEPVCAKNGVTRMDVTLLTGRPHQIRVQHAHAGYPLVGDARYGSGGGPLALFAYSLTIEHPTRKELMTFETPLPKTEPWIEYE